MENTTKPDGYRETDKEIRRKSVSREDIHRYKERDKITLESCVERLEL